MRPKISTRKWSSGEGYKYLAPWTNAVLLRFLIRKFTATLPHLESRRKDQLDDAGRSVISNIEEGYKRPSTREYLNFLGYSQGSLEEVKGLFRQACQDGFLASSPDSSLSKTGIDLKKFKELLKDFKGNIPLDVLYPPLKALTIPRPPFNFLKPTDLTFEMLLELVNKTDYLFRQLVESLEKSVTKEDMMSSMERWRGEQRQKERKRIQESDRWLKETMRGQGLIFTRHGYVKIEEAAKRGLKEIGN